MRSADAPTFLRRASDHASDRWLYAALSGVGGGVGGVIGGLVATTVGYGAAFGVAAALVACSVGLLLSTRFASGPVGRRGPR